MDGRIKEAMDALDRIDIELGGENAEEGRDQAYSLSVKTLRWAAVYSQHRDDDGWNAHIMVFYRDGFIRMDVAPDATYWTKKEIKKIARRAYKDYHNYGRQK